MTWCREEGYLIIGSGMAVHSFPSIFEIQAASTPDEKTLIHDRNLKESRDFDTYLREALQHRGAVERKTALLGLKKLREFGRSHPTVEVC